MPLFLQPFTRYADFNGRARRAEYWQWVAFQFVVGFVFGLLKATDGAGMIAILQVIFALATLVPSIAVAVRRFHDIDRTGWWYMFPGAILFGAIMIYIPFGGTGFMEAARDLENVGSNPTNAQVASLMTILMPMLWVVLAYSAAALVTFIFHITPGTNGPNRFGPDPKGDGTHIARVFDAPEGERTTRETYDGGDQPYKPVFDFGPSGKTQMRDAPVAEAAPALTRPMPQAGTPTRPVFGKRR